MKIIGLVKERKDGENRVALIPEHVAILANKGHTIFVEESAGLGSGFSDQDYANSHPNVRVVPTNEVYKNANFIVKVKEPIDFDLQYLSSQHSVFSYLHLAPNPKLTRTLIERNIDSYAFESIQDVHGKYPMLVPMSEIAGKLAIHFAAEHLRNGYEKYPGALIGPSTKVVVCGCGTAGAAAAKLAIKLGCEVVVGDMNFNSVLSIPYASKGYDLKDARQSAFFYENEVTTADVFIGAVLIPNKRAPIVVSHDLVKQMKKYAIIVDIAIDQGGCVETSTITSHTNPVSIVEGIRHICIPNMPGCVPSTASERISFYATEYIFSGKYVDGANIINGKPVIDLGL
ncbi:MAG: alanine dehydrogenase [Gammaproteobacteria bacterium]